MNSRLSTIETLWSMVRHASDSRATAAQEELLDRYGDAIRRYLRAALRDEHAADDLYQEFAFKLIRGDFRTADPEKGRFRVFIKTCLRRMIIDAQRTRSGRKLTQLPAAEPAAAAEPTGDDEDFTRHWRRELLRQATLDLQEREATTSKPLHTVLRARIDHPDAPSDQLAVLLSAQLGREISHANVRVLLHRSREAFAQCLVDRIVETLEDPTREELEQELIQLDLLRQCRPVLDRRDRDKAQPLPSD
jgi:RNA polymerase sigma-70 factor (ECF subfamily)